MAHERPIAGWAFLLTVGGVELLSDRETAGAIVKVDVQRGGARRYEDDVSARPDFGQVVSIRHRLCVALALMSPENLQMYKASEHLAPGFRWVSPESSFLGPVEGFCGLYIAAL
jgi:hypothetical protein